MTVRRSFAGLLVVILAVAWFIWRSSQGLPGVVAIHYALDGVADGFSSRGESLAFWLGIAVAVPLVTALLPMGMMALVGATGLKIPHREYWLAPERKDATLEYFKALYCWLACALALFVGYMHWLDVRAQQVQPPELSTGGLIVGLAILVLVWIGGMALASRRFKTIPHAGQA